MRRTILVVLLSLCVFPSLRAQTIAKYAGEFLAIGVGGRALGLGGAYAALANDATAGYWNPSALSRIDYPEFVLMHDERFGGLMNYDFGAVAIPYGSDMSFGLSLSRLSVDDIPDTRNALIDYNNNGVFDPEDRPDPNRVTYFNVADWVLTLTYAKRSSDAFRYGANVKLIRRNFGDFSATGVGFDVGVLYSPLQDLWLAANAQDVTTTLIAWSTGRNELVSPTLKLGAAYFLSAFNGRFAPTMDVDVRFENRQSASIANIGPISLDPHFGLEFDYKRTAAIRIGYSDVKQLTVGAGLHLRKLDLDYSFARFGKENDLGDTHRISLRFMLQEERWGRGNAGNIGE
ncbi:MAG: PorV/PorQ family protein [Bacteroidetes bacterium]|nr:PorV/PorQ family protein [Bacteroidota bacterium]